MCEGSVGDNLYISLWSLDVLKNYNEMYSVNEFAPELFLIGSDGGDTAYGIKRDNLSYIEVPFIGMSLEESKYLGNSFNEFIDTLIIKSNL